MAETHTHFHYFVLKPALSPLGKSGQVTLTDALHGLPFNTPLDAFLAAKTPASSVTCSSTSLHQIPAVMP
jgi:hypothetical protein